MAPAMILKFIRYLRSRLPRDEVLGPWIEEMKTHREKNGPSDPKEAPDLDPDNPSERPNP